MISTSVSIQERDRGGGTFLRQDLERFVVPADPHGSSQGLNWRVGILGRKEYHLIKGLITPALVLAQLKVGLPS